MTVLESLKCKVRELEAGEEDEVIKNVIIGLKIAILELETHGGE